ncbi:hypothetical protein BC829DRAFT_250149 [Chytridium lagenaria]|nr:hypothetical protein BC829DRAFT_250149 [Chytridium lagenaria]
MGWNHMPNSEAVRRRSPGEENGALGSSELVMIRGLDAESQRKVAEARTRRSSSVPKNGLPNPSAEMHRGSWSRRVSEVLMPGLATYRRNSEIGNQLGYFTDKLSGRPLGELFEVENRYYRLVLEANDKLWIWTWNGDFSNYDSGSASLNIFV